MSTNHPIATRNPARAAAIVLLAGAVIGVGACAKDRVRARADETTPTNAGLANLTGNRGPLTIEPAPADDFAPTREWALRAASQLEEIMDKIPGSEGYNQHQPTQAAQFDASQANAGRSGEAGRAGASSSVGAGGAGIDPDPVAISQAPDPDAGEPAQQTRFSLAAFADNEHADTEINPTGTTPGTDIPPELAAGNADPETGGVPDPTPLRPLPASNPEQRKQQLVDELVTVLGELAQSGDGPGSAALALAGLESLRPQALDGLKGQGLLSDAEIASLDAARELFAALSSENGIAGPSEVSSVLDRIRRDLDARAGLRINRAELCTRVGGFGQYETFPSNRFVAGRAQPVIVYTEVDRFTHRESVGPDAQPRYEIEVSQRLELYHTADNLNTWNRAAETNRMVSRNRVRDYYLINQVTLPSNLSIGKYNLKIVMRDLVGGHVAETIIPIEIVSGATASGM